ncbi:uncharacterized protein LOC144154811 [Haemaphysalis longicornis]
MLVRLELLPEVIALGAYQMNHVWAVTFKDADGAKKFVAAGEVQVKGRRCVVIHPRNQDVRLKLHWVLHFVPDDEIRAALGPYGKVTEVTRDRWRVQGCTAQSSTTRLVTLKLKVGVSVDDLPHQLRVAGEQALVVVPGRVPVCLRCHRSGHIRRECRVPRCASCRRFGHDESECVRTYANVTGPTKSDREAEYIMDAADAEDAAKGEDVVPSPEVTPPEPASAVKPPVTNAEVTPPNDAGREDTASLPVPQAVSSSDKQHEGELTVAGTSASEPMEEGAAENGAAAVKRARELCEEGGTLFATNEEPPTKAAVGGRRSSFKPKPNITLERQPMGQRPP